MITSLFMPVVPVPISPAAMKPVLVMIVAAIIIVINGAIAAALKPVEARIFIEGPVAWHQSGLAIVNRAVTATLESIRADIVRDLGAADRFRPVI